MIKFHRRNLRHIEKIFEEKSGVSITKNSIKEQFCFKKSLAFAVAVLCLISMTAFAYIKFSDLNGDHLELQSSYKGNGKFEITVTNLSDRELKLQKNVKLMRWSTAQAVDGDSEKIHVEVETIRPHSQAVMFVDLSEGYNIALLEEELPEGDWYYLVLTNNDFAFGQDWMCDLIFDTGYSASVVYGREDTPEPNYAEDCMLAYGDWIWPTASRAVSVLYGEQANGWFSDHVNITGKKGDQIYSVADGTVLETGFEREYGNYIIIEMENSVYVKYGHLEKCKVQEGEMVLQGQEIGTMGQSGMSTGPNLALKVWVDGETVNPFASE